MRESKWDKVNGRGVKLESGDGSDSGKRQKEQGGSEQLFDWTDNQTPRLKREGGGGSSVLRGDVEGEDEVCREEQSRGGLKKNTEMK